MFERYDLMVVGLEMLNIHFYENHAADVGTPMNTLCDENYCLSDEKHENDIFR